LLKSHVSKSGVFAHSSTSAKSPGVKPFPEIATSWWSRSFVFGFTDTCATTGGLLTAGH
jgi:hypothetical protein